MHIQQGRHPVVEQVAWCIQGSDLWPRECSLALKLDALGHRRMFDTSRAKDHDMCVR